MSADSHALAARLTNWFEHRLVDTGAACAPPGSAVQLYGLEVVDPDGIDDHRPGAVRAVFIDEAADEVLLLSSPAAHRAFDFDAVAVVGTVWALGASGPRPGEFPARRRRVRVEVLAVRGTPGQ